MLTHLRLSVTELDLMVKTEWNDPLEGDNFVDTAAAADNLCEDSSYGQDSNLPEDSRKAPEEDESPPFGHLIQKPYGICRKFKTECNR